jgi:signal transduction histidine kinase
MGFSELLTKEFTKMDDSQKLGLIDLINVSSESAFNLLENLLQWARTQTDKIKFYPENIDLSELIESNIKFHKVSALKKKIKLESKVPANTVVYADSNMINTVLRNLISNAIKFTDTDGKITISADSTEDMVNVSVTDTGIGIDPETIDKLFRIDTYHTSVGTSGESGTGLGLIISREFIDKHSGKMNVTSKPGRGSTFSFTIPAGKN